MRRAVGRGADGAVQLSDSVGDLVALDGVSAVLDRHGERVEIPLSLVVAARPVLPSTADELALQAIAAASLRPAETDQLGGWLLRADAGFTRRANSVLPLRQPGMPMGEALERAHAWYAARSLPLLVQVPLSARRLLDADLAERGWPAEAHTRLLVARLDMLHASPASASVLLRDQPDDGWLGAYRDGAGTTEQGRALLSRHDRVCFASVRINERVVAVGRGTVDDGWLGVMAVEVDPSHRRQGLATAVLGALWQWGRENGAVRSYVQVLADNTTAAAMYEQVGYYLHHEYHYRREI